MSTASSSAWSALLPTPTLIGWPRSPRSTRVRLFVDRSLTPAVAKALDRFPEIHAVHLHDVYTHGERVPDVQWLADIGDDEWVGVTQNFVIPQVAAERATIQQHRTRVYSLSRANYPPLTQGLLLGRNIVRMIGQGRRREPAFWRVSHNGVIRDI